MKKYKKYEIIALCFILIFVCKQQLLSKKNKVIQPTHQEVSFCCVGDCLLNQRILDVYSSENGYNFDSIFSEIKKTIKSYDISVVNQETVLVDDKYVSARPYGSPKQIADSLIKTGFNVILHQNNHMFDKGICILRKSNEYWKKKNVVNVGISSEPVYYEKNGISFNFYNYTYGVNYNKCMSLENYKDKLKNVNLLYSKKNKFIRQLKNSTTDFQICFLHMGEEYSTYVEPKEKEYISDLIDAGADVVICSHPHVIRKYEMLNTKNGNKGLVYYSCGNFLATQELGMFENQIGGIADIVFDKDGIVKYTFIPTVCHYSENNVKVMLLEKYSDEIAKKSLMYKENSGYTYKNLLKFWKRTVIDNSK